MMVEKDVFVGMSHTNNTTTRERTVHVIIEDADTAEYIVEFELDVKQFMRVMGGSTSMVAAKVHKPDD